MRCPVDSRGLAVIATSFDEAYLPGAMAMLRSVSASVNPETTSLRVYVLLSREATFGWSEFCANLRAGGFEGELHPVLVDLERFDSIPWGPGTSMMPYARLLLPDLLPGEERIIYVDADIILARDLSILMVANLDGHPLAATPDYFVKSFRRDHTHRDMERFRKNDLYFNSGLLVLDLKKLRTMEFTDKAIRFLREQGDRVEFHDQSVLNVFLGRSVKWLGMEWNFPAWLAHRYKFRAAAPMNIHYLGGLKPWHSVSEDYPELARFRRFVGEDWAPASSLSQPSFRHRLDYILRQSTFGAAALVRGRIGDFRFACALLRLARWI